MKPDMTVSGLESRQVVEAERHYVTDSGFRLIVRSNGECQLTEPQEGIKKPLFVECSLCEIRELAAAFAAAKEDHYG
jgi:hypothetical protein